jgi:transposase
VVEQGQRCAGCQAPLTANVAVVLRERRQVHDVPPLRRVVREHQGLHLPCPQCQTVTVAAFPTAEVSSRAQYVPQLRALVVYLVQQQLVPYVQVRELLADLFGARLSLGTLVGWAQQAAATLEPVEAAIKAALQQVPMLHNDETRMRQAGHVAWAHVASTARLTHYAIHPHRGRDATDAIGILPSCHGLSVHDGWKPYWVNTQGRHALCNIHHLRELTFLEEEYAQTWAKELKGLLREMKAATDKARARGVTRLLQTERDGFVARYERLLAAGLGANPPPARRPRQRGWIKQPPVRNLLERLLLGQDAVLAFLDDLTIPFDNDQAERDLRMLKVQQNISVCFHTPTRSAAFARLCRYFSTLRKQGHALLAALEALFTGQPLYPAFDWPVTGPVSYASPTRSTALPMKRRSSKPCPTCAISVQGAWAPMLVRSVPSATIRARRGSPSAMGWCLTS